MQKVMSYEIDGRSVVIDMTKVKPRCVNKFIDAFAISKVGMIDRRVRMLSQHIIQKTPGERIITCDVCGGVIDTRLNACPYCGDTKLADIHEAEWEKAQYNGREVLRATCHAACKVIVEQYLVLRQADVENQWNMARLIFQLHYSDAHKLWEENGVRKYQTWEDFVEGELGMSAVTAGKAVAIFTHYSKEQIETIPKTKLALALSVPEDARPEFIEKNKDAATREFAKKIAEYLPNADPPKRAKRHEEYRKRNQDKAAATAAKSIEATVPLRAFEVKMRAKGGKRYAKDVDDGPNARVDFGEFVVYATIIRDLDGDLLLRLEASKS